MVTYPTLPRVVWPTANLPTRYRDGIPTSLAGPLCSRPRVFATRHADQGQGRATKRANPRPQLTHFLDHRAVAQTLSAITQIRAEKLTGAATEGHVGWHRHGVAGGRVTERASRPGVANMDRLAPAGAMHNNTPSTTGRRIVLAVADLAGDKLNPGGNHPPSWAPRFDKMRRAKLRRSARR